MRLIYAVILGAIVAAILTWVFWRIRIWWIGQHSRLGGLEDIPQSASRLCGDCGVKIIPENDSGWDGFFRDTNGRMYTQRLCKTCDTARSAGGFIKTDD